MNNQTELPEKKTEVREKSPQEISEETRRGIEFQHGIPGRVEGQLQEMQKEPGVEDAEKDLGGKMTEIARVEEALKDVVRQGDYKNLSVDDKVKFHEAFEKAKFYAMHAFAGPANVEDIQRQWEQAAESFEKYVQKPLEQTKGIIAGEISAEDASRIQHTIPYGAERMRSNLEDSTKLEVADRNKLLDELNNELAAAQNAATEVARIANEKKIPEDQKDARITAYNASVKIYKERQKTLYELLERVRDYAPPK